MRFQIHSNLISLITILFGVVHYVLASDCEYAVAAYKELGGDVYDTVSSFSDCCNDLGITCDSSNHITGIKIEDFKNTAADFEKALSGLANLSQLESLEISNTQSKLGVPLSPIVKLENLKKLILSNNKSEDDVKATIPSEIGNLTNLEELVLTKNNLKGNIPLSLANLKHLKKLDLSNNNLSGYLPYKLKDLTKLTEVAFDNNSELTGYVPLIPNVVIHCSYGSTDLCYLKSTKCKSGISGCTIQDIQGSNKVNGAPGQSTYESEVVQAKRDKVSAAAGGGSFLSVIILIICCCCCIKYCRSDDTVYVRDTIKIDNTNTNTNVNNNTPTVNNYILTSPTPAAPPPQQQQPTQIYNYYGNVTTNSNNNNTNSNNTTDASSPPPYFENPSVYMPSPVQPPPPVVFPNNFQPSAPSMDEKK